MPNLEHFLLPKKGGTSTKTNQRQAFPISLLEYLIRWQELQHLSNLQQTHSDKLPLPGQSIEDVQLAVAMTLPQASVNKDTLGVCVVGRRVSSSTWGYGSRSRGVHGKPEVVVWEEVKKEKDKHHVQSECAHCASF